MGNSEGSHGRSHSHTASPQHSSTTVPNERVKRHARHKSAVVSSLVDQNDETYYTCKTSLSGTGQNGNGDPPSTYFYQLPTVRGAHSQTLAGPISRRVDKIDFSVPQPQTHAAVSQQQPRLARMQSQTQNVSTQQPIKVTVVQQETIGKDLLDTEHDDRDSGYLTAGTGFIAEAHALRPQMSTLTKADLKSRIERFNENTHALRMNMDNLTGVIHGFVRVYMHILSPISMRQTKPNSLYDVVSKANGKDEQSDLDAGVQTTKLCVPQDFTGLVNVTSKSRTTEVIQLLLSKYNIVDSADRFALYERDIEMKTSRKLSADEVPLMLSLAWSDEGAAVLDRKQFVLRETNIEKPQWEAFSLPELNNFLTFLTREEEEQIQQIRIRYAELHQHINKRLQCLAQPTVN